MLAADRTVSVIKEGGNVYTRVRKRQRRCFSFRLSLFSFGFGLERDKKKGVGVVGTEVAGTSDVPLGNKLTMKVNVLFLLPFSVSSCSFLLFFFRLLLFISLN